MNIKVTKSEKPIYLFNITQIVFGTKVCNDYSGNGDIKSYSVDCVWVYNASNTEGFSIVGTDAINEVREKLVVLDSEFLVIEADID